MTQQQQHVVEVPPPPERGGNGDGQRTPSVDIPAPPIASGNGDGRRWDEGRPAFDRVAVAQFAMILFIVVEAMTFAGLISAFFSIRGSVDFWPPLDQPRYPVQATAINTAILLASGVTMLLFRRVWHRDPAAFGKLTFLILATAFLGALFVGLQGIEWAQLIGFGLTVTSSSYGSIFYVIIGFHAFHVVAAVLWLCITSGLAVRKKFPPGMLSLETVGIFWYFVVLVWPVLYAVVYF